MTIERIQQLVAVTRFPLRIVTSSGRTYVVDRPAGIGLEPRAVRVVRDGYDIVLLADQVERVEGGRQG